MEFDSEGRLIIVNDSKRKDLTKDEIVFWKNKYDKEEDLYNRGDENELRKSFNEKGFMSKADLSRIIKWKFQGRLLGRQKVMLNHIKDCNSEFIEKLSKEAFQSKDDEIRITLLSNIPAVKNSLSSVILTFYDPSDYGILDIHSWRELFGEEPKDIFSNKKRAIDFFKKLREISKNTGLSCRDIEKALFKKNLDENK
ncbi:MAG: hypothetical protein Q8L29_04445 [archaeon]|nr:hypothetical protein [archaeon]